MPAAALPRRRWPSTLPRKAPSSRISRFRPNKNRDWRLADQLVLRDMCARSDESAGSSRSPSLLAINLRPLSTSAQAPTVRVDPSASRRGTCDRGDLEEAAGVCGGRGPVTSLLMGIQWPVRSNPDYTNYPSGTSHASRGEQVVLSRGASWSQAFLARRSLSEIPCRSPGSYDETPGSCPSLSRLSGRRDSEGTRCTVTGNLDTCLCDV